MAQCWAHYLVCVLPDVISQLYFLFIDDTIIKDPPLRRDDSQMNFLVLEAVDFGSYFVHESKYHRGISDPINKMNYIRVPSSSVLDANLDNWVWFPDLCIAKLNFNFNRLL